MPKSQFREEDTYLDIGTRFVKSITGLHPDWDVAFSNNKFLPQMIQEIEEKLGGKTDYNGLFQPNLKLDILLGIKKKSNDSHISLVLLEVKVEQLTLNHHAQLLGYLVAAPMIKCGILLSSNVGRFKGAFFSSEYESLLNMNAVPMAFSIDANGATGSFRTGVAFGQYRGMIEWRNLQAVGSITGFPSLCDYIEEI